MLSTVCINASIRVPMRSVRSHALNDEDWAIARNNFRRLTNEVSIKGKIKNIMYIYSAIGYLMYIWLVSEQMKTESGKNRIHSQNLQILVNMGLE